MANLEALYEDLRVLVARRQALHDGNAGRDELESNRLELVGVQHQLSLALIERYLPRADR